MGDVCLHAGFVGVEALLVAWPMGLIEIGMIKSISSFTA
jgi:hypothetical protein